MQSNLGEEKTRHALVHLRQIRRLTIKVMLEWAVNSTRHNVRLTNSLDICSEELTSTQS